MPADGGADPGVAKTVATRPPEEIIKLDFDDVVRPEGVVVEGSRKSIKREAGADGSIGPKGKGKGRRPEPKPARQNIGPGLKKFTRPGLDGKVPVANDKKLGGQIKHRARQDRNAVMNLIKSEVLQTAEAGYLEAEGRERTSKISQAELEGAVGIGIARQRFSFNVPYGPYACGYTTNGQYLLTGGRKGHVSLLNCESMKISAELQLKETVRAVQMLHNHTMFAVAQKKYAYIYDQTGLELHCLKDHKYPTHLDFLPYHYLLITAGEMGDMRYRDISTGQEVVCHRTRLGPVRSLRQNPRNAVMHVGHSNGTVTLWTPTVKTPVVKVQCHAGHVTALAVHGNYMVSAGADGLWKVWDLRKYDSVHAFRSYGNAVADVDVSMTGLVAVGFGSHLEIWKGVFGSERQKRPYMTEEYPGSAVNSVRFRPYQDIVAVGHLKGFGSLIVPGAGQANFDSFEANPFETKKQRREKEVRSLLEKLQPDSIMLDPNQIGSVNKTVVQAWMKESEQKRKEEEEAAKKDQKKKKKMRGKGKVGARMKRKSLKEGQTHREKAKGRAPGEEGDSSGNDGPDAEDVGPDHSRGGEGGQAASVVAGSALSRFYGKRRRKT